MKQTLKLIILSTLILSVATSIAQETCEAIVQQAIETASENCDGLRRNEACYGNITIDAEAAPDIDDFTFDNAGDIVNISDIASMRLSSDLGTGDWGISILSLQAGQPDSLEDVRIALMGNVTIADTSHLMRLFVVANARTRLRSSPNTETDFNILRAIDAGTQLEAFGRTESGEWLRVHTNGTTGWITSLLVDGDANRMELPVVDISEPYFGPMQAFTIQTSDSTDCEDVPPDGLLIQTPEGSGLIEFRVNEVSIWLGSTAFITITEDNNLRTYLLEGQSNVTAQGQREFMPPGTFVDVPLDNSGTAPSGVPNPPQPYDADDVDNLPIQLVTQPQTQAITIADPVPEGQVQDAIAETFISNPYGLIDGWYRLSVLSFEQNSPNPFTDGYCASGGTVLNTLHTEFSDGFQWEIIVVDSPTSFTFRNVLSADDGGCTVEHRGVWVPSQPQ